MDNFTSRKQAVHWLQAQGYKISVPRIYKDVNKGLLILEPDGSIRAEALERYIKAAGLQQPAKQTVDSSIRADARASEEIRQLQLKNEKLDIELAVLRKEFLDRADVELHLALTIGIFEAAFKNLIRTSAFDLVQMTAGDSKKTNMICDFLYPRINDLLDQMGQMDEINVVVQKEAR